MSRRKIVDEKDARASLAAVAKSGTSLRDWAQRHGVDGRSLRAWHINLSRGTGQQHVVELVPRPTAGAERRYVIRVGRGAIEVGDDFDSRSLARIVEVLASC